MIKTSLSCDKTGLERKPDLSIRHVIVCCAVLGDVGRYVSSLWTRSRHFHSQHTFTFRCFLFFFFFTATAIWISGRALSGQNCALRFSFLYAIVTTSTFVVEQLMVGGLAIRLWSTLRYPVYLQLTNSLSLSNLTV